MPEGRLSGRTGSPSLSGHGVLLCHGQDVQPTVVCPHRHGMRRAEGSRPVVDGEADGSPRETWSHLGFTWCQRNSIETSVLCDSTLGEHGADLGLSRSLSSPPMRPLLLSAAALVVIGLGTTASAQSPSTVSPGATVVLPYHAGEVVRITTADRQPTGRGRLAQRYRGLRVYRDRGASGARVVRATPVAPVLRTPGGQFVRRNGTFFPVGSVNGR